MLSIAIMKRKVSVNSPFNFKTYQLIYSGTHNIGIFRGYVKIIADSYIKD